MAVIPFQLSTRFRNNVDEKMRKLGYIGVGVSTVGQRLVDTITKTFVTLSAVVVCMIRARCSLFGIFNLHCYRQGVYFIKLQQ